MAICQRCCLSPTAIVPLLFYLFVFSNERLREISNRERKSWPFKLRHHKQLLLLLGGAPPLRPLAAPSYLPSPTSCDRRTSPPRCSFSRRGRQVEAAPPPARRSPCGWLPSRPTSAAIAGSSSFFILCHFFFCYIHLFSNSIPLLLTSFVYIAMQLYLQRQDSL